MHAKVHQNFGRILTRIANRLTSVTRSTSTSLRHRRSLTNSVSPSWLPWGLRPRDCTSTSTASCKYRSRSHLLSSTFFSPNILSRSRECFRVASAFSLLVSRSALTLIRAFSEILAFSSRATRASSLRVKK
jgi:hypothetical protein